MDQLIFDNHKLLIKIKDEYDKLLLENEELKKHITNLEKQLSVKPPSKVIIYDDNIPEDIVYKFGEGPIRYFENGKYYHGLGINEKQRWVVNKFYKNFLLFHKGRSLAPSWINFNTHNAITFCCNCEYNNELNKSRTKNKFYECLGHKVEIKEQ